MTHRSSILAFLTSAVLATSLSACEMVTGDCIGLPESGVLVELRTSAGAPTVLGSTVTLVRAGGPVDTVGPITRLPHESTWTDSAHVSVADNRRGWYLVTATRPNWTTASRAVRVPGTRCGDVETQRVRLVIDPLPDAPPVRGVAVEPRAWVVTDCRIGLPLSVLVDAAPGVSRAVEWRTSDPAVAVVSPAGIVSTRRRGRATITAVSAVDERAWGSTEMLVERSCM